jgi:NADH-quinone oxidoreductase subunit J
MFCLAALYVMMDAHFRGDPGAVYAGAIMVVFLFVVMLLNSGTPTSSRTCAASGTRPRLLVGISPHRSWRSRARVRKHRCPVILRSRNLGQRGGAIAKPLFSDHLLAFELTSVLLLVAIVGAVVIGKRRAST